MANEAWVLRNDPAPSSCGSTTDAVILANQDMVNGADVETVDILRTRFVTANGIWNREEALAGKRGVGPGTWTLRLKVQGTTGSGPLTHRALVAVLDSGCNTKETILDQTFTTPDITHLFVERELSASVGRIVFDPGDVVLVRLNIETAAGGTETHGLKVFYNKDFDSGGSHLENPEESVATYFVDGAVGDDANDGLSEGSGGAWATIDKAMNTVVAGDKVWVKASATYTETATIDTAGNSSTGPIEFEGYTSTTGDLGQATIDGGSIRTNCLADSITGTLFYVFRNFKFINATGDGALLHGNQVIFSNCEANNNGGDGFDCGNGMVWEECRAEGNTSHGMSGGTTCTMIGSVSGANGSDGVRITHGTVVGSVFYSNTGDAIVFLGSNGFANVTIGNTIDGDSKDTNTGIQFPASFWAPNVAINNIIYDCTTGMTGRNQGNRLSSRNNLLFNNTANYGTGYQTFTGEVTSDPSFTDEANNDYTLQSGSPASDAGFDGAQASGGTSSRDIGALESGGGSGGSGGAAGPVVMLSGGRL